MLDLESLTCHKLKNVPTAQFMVSCVLKSILLKIDFIRTSKMCNIVNRMLMLKPETVI